MNQTEKIRELEELRLRLAAEKKKLESDTVSIDDYTYGAPTIYAWGEGAKLKIGKFCSIAKNVSIVLGGNHRVDWNTTYPFNVLLPNSFGYIKGHPATNGDITIGNDVWIANGVKIMSGVTIGDGAVIGANALVTRDVGPYEVVGGVPAKLIKRRFSKKQIALLLEMKWWDWPQEKLVEAIPYLQSSDVDSLIGLYRK